MRLLLDTQVALWWLLGAKRLAGTARRQLGAASCVVSAASVWEVAIKHRLAKLPIAPGRFRDAMIDAGASILPVSDDHAIASADIVLTHDDPFDRLLTAVAREEGLRFATADARLLDAAKANPGLLLLEVRADPAESPATGVRRERRAPSCLTPRASPRSRSSAAPGAARRCPR